MKLWILKPITDWDPWYDKAFGFIIRAETEMRARVIAGENAGAEFRDYPIHEEINPWLVSTITSCIELTVDGKEEMIIRDFAAA